MKNKRIVNLRFKVCGLHFDAAIDCDWELHCYKEIEHNVTPIELYCFDKPEWDIRMVYQEKRNDQRKEQHAINHTEVDWDNLLKETRKWVREMKRKSKNTNHNDKRRDTCDL
jgi:hypothetical protein